MNNLLYLLPVLALLLSIPGPEGQAQVSTQPPLNVCRYAITSLSSPQGYPLSTLGIGSYLDWSAAGTPVLPLGVEYVRVLLVGNQLVSANKSRYANSLESLPGWLQTYPGSTWLVGNEPDTNYGNQDGLVPTDYADRFFTLAQMIRQGDPTARIGFGTIVQPTPIRLKYLDLAWNRLVTKAGSQAAASALIDVWSIHSFILNEAINEWGTGVPPGYTSDWGSPDKINIPDGIGKTHDINLFKERVQAFRTWMAGIGERDKPVWITEYGSLLPPIDPPGQRVYQVSDQDTANFMSATFDYLLTASDQSTGMAADNNRLVQRWFWYSLNDKRYNFGGTLFDPDNNRQATLVGQRFMNYNPPGAVESNLAVVSVDRISLYRSGGDGIHVDYLVTVRLRTALDANAPVSAAVALFENGSPVSESVTSLQIGRCGGVQTVTMIWKNVEYGKNHTLTIKADAIGHSDSNLADNQLAYSVIGSTLGKPEIVFLPIIGR